MNIRKILEKYKKNNSYTAITKNAYFMKLYTDMKYIRQRVHLLTCTHTHNLVRTHVTHCLML